MPRIIDVDRLDLSEIVKAGDVVAWGQACAEPLTLTRGLMAARRKIGPIGAFIGISLGATPDPSYADDVRFMSFCGTGTNRRLAGAGKLDILPIHYSDLPAALERRVDVLMLQLAQAPDGRYSLAAACDYVQDLARTARTVIAEVNRQAPFTDAAIDVSEIDYLVHTDYGPLELEHAEPSDVDRRIAARVADLVEDGATMQFGLGAIPETVAALLGNRRDLGLHTGIMSDAAMELMLSGAITNALKPFDAGKSVTGSLLGSRRLLDFADHNPAISMRPISYTHALSRLAELPRFTAVNSAVEVDLRGQANTEMAGGRYVGAVGGAVDFARGAKNSVGGLPILALPSTAVLRDGSSASRIVCDLSGPATIGQADSGIVVTEHGHADLRGLSLSERVKSLVAIAAPEFRDELRAAASR